MKLQLDQWQQDVMDTEGNICLRSGRQVGKSTVISCKVGEYATKHHKKLVMVIAAVERQALLLFEKILAYIVDNYKSQIKTGKDRPTRHKISLKNGSVIHCLPTGDSGYGIRGYTVDLLVADEAAFIPEEVWTAITPMLAITRGDIILLSTPHGKEGYYFDCFQDPNFKSFHISSEECPRKNQKFLDREKARMTKIQYAQEYLGEFVSELKQFFPDDLIKEICILNRRDHIRRQRKYFLGVDVAGMGKDESTFEIFDGTNLILQQVENQMTRKTRTNETIDKINQLDVQYSFNRIYVDDAGIGVGVFDQLMINPQTKRKTVGISNARRSIDRDGRKKKLLKEDLYNNLKRLMEHKMVYLLNDDEVKLSLKSIQWEELGDYGSKNLKIYGNYSHITEGIIRAAWGVKDKGLNVFARTF